MLTSIKSYSFVFKLFSSTLKSRHKLINNKMIKMGSIRCFYATNLCANEQKSLFGKNDFGKNDFGKNDFGKNDFGKNDFGKNESRESEKLKRMSLMLRDYDFTDKQIEMLLNAVGKYVNEENSLNAEEMRKTIECWRMNVRPPNINPSQLDRMAAEDVDYDMTIDFNTVVTKIEPHLMLMNPPAIEKRISCIKSLGIITGPKDLWRVFVYAPRAFFLQEWKDFLKKYHYLNFRVLEWLLNKKDKDNLYPHPLVRNSKVFELSFDEIRCRHLFAERTGLKSVSVANKLSQVKAVDKIDLRALMLTSVEHYLNIVAPYCKPEEFYVFEKMLAERQEEDEEEKIIEEFVELQVNEYNASPANTENVPEPRKKYQTISHVK